MDNFDLRKYLAEGRLFEQELRDVEDILIKAGFRFEDGILGGVGSGGAGYYDAVNDRIYGFNQKGPWNEEEFNKFYDNFTFASDERYQEDLEDMGIDINFDMIYQSIKPGIYAVGDEGYVKIPTRVPNRDGGDVIEIYAIPQLASEDNSKFLPAFKMDANGKAIPQFSKDEMRRMLKDDMMYIL